MTNMSIHDKVTKIVKFGHTYEHVSMKKGKRFYVSATRISMCKRSLGITLCCSPVCLVFYLFSFLLDENKTAAAKAKAFSLARQK